MDLSRQNQNLCLIHNSQILAHQTQPTITHFPSVPLHHRRRGPGSLPASPMAPSVNNIAATFATTLSLSSSSSKTQLPFLHPISASWNPQTYLHKSYKSSLLATYGPPGPSPFPPQSSTLRPRHHCQEMMKLKHQSPSVHIGHKLPNITLSFVDPANKLRTTKLSSLCSSRGRKGLVLIGVTAAFSPRCNEYVKKTVESTAKSKAGATDLIACVAVDNVFAMKAWGEMLAVDCGRMMMMRMLSDQHGELFDVLSSRSKRFCLSTTFDGVITSIEVDDDNDCDVDKR